MYVCTYVRMYVCVCVYICMHTHTHVSCVCVCALSSPASELPHAVCLDVTLTP